MRLIFKGSAAKELRAHCRNSGNALRRASSQYTEATQLGKSVDCEKIRWRAPISIFRTPRGAKTQL